MTTIYSALITPFQKDDTLDEEGLISLIHEQKAAKIDGVIALGTTGETPTLVESEKRRIIELCVEHSDKMLVIVGCGSSSTAQAILNTKQAADLGARSVLVTSPPYNKPTDAGLMAHFKAVADNSALPVILYNHPSRTGCNLTPKMQFELATHPNIIGVKESSPDLIQVSDILLQRPPNYFVLAGDDLQTLPFLALGAEGIASVAANLIPHLIRELVDTRSIELQKRLWPFLHLIFSESNPIGIKGALEFCGKPCGNPRLPLLPMSETGKSKLASLMEKLCLQ